MELSSLNVELSRLIKQRNVTILLNMALILVIIVLSLVLLFKDTIVVVTPSVIAKEYRITDKNISKSYLEDMSRDVVTTLFNLTPKNVSYMTDTVLKLVHPSAYGQVSKELYKLQHDVITRKVSTVFYPSSMVVDENNLLVRIQGDFYTFIGSSLTAHKKRLFEIHYDYTGAKLTIGGFSEIVED
tara:strand:+ start:262 stop:816 length:555 start_codon:yes stop_codon:yes gene_type:complete